MMIEGYGSTAYTVGFDHYIARPACGGGGIGRHAGFRFQWGNPCGFKSRSPHQLESPRHIAAGFLVAGRA